MSSSPATHKPALAHMATRGFSIRTRLIALVLAALLPALWADLWVMNLTHRLEREASARLLEKTTQALSMVLDRELAPRPDAAPVLPGDLQRIIDAQHLANDWRAAIIDRQGRVVARHPNNTEYTGRLITPELQAHISAHGEGLLDTISLDGQPVTIYFSTSPQGWTYVTGMSRERFQGLVPKAVFHVGMGLLLLLVVSLMGAVWVARGIVRPIQTIKQMALDLREGRRVASERTGLLECDQVALAMGEAARSIQQARDELERQVSAAVERTHQLEQHVSHNQRVEALGRLTGGLAHEFNNLLGIIGNSAHLMRRQSTAPGLTPAIDATLRAVDTGGRLTQHLLRFAGRQSVRPCALSLQHFLPEAGELLRALLGRRIELLTSVDADTPPVFVDPNELELALINLALNARDAIEGHGQLQLHATLADTTECEGLPSQRCVRITVRDDGPGMEAAIAQRVFEPFFSTKPPHEGTGLGLSQVYGFCQQAQGRVRLQSTPRLGTTVTLVLPAHSHTPDAGHPALPHRPSIDHARVLLIEDNAALREATRALLHAYGCEVVAAVDAHEALERIDTHPDIDVVLSDVVMPGDMDGIALANHLRQKLPHLPVVLISGHAGDAPLPPGVALLHKPCAPDTLVAALEHAMGQHPTL